LIQKKIPVSASRFALEKEANKDFGTKKYITDIFVTLETAGVNFQDALQFIDKRIQRVETENQDIKAFNPDDTKEFRQVVDEATSDIKETIQAVHMIGFGMGALPAGKRDAEALTAIQKLAEYRRDDGNGEIYNDVIAMAPPGEISSTEGFFNVAMDLFALRSNKDLTRVSDYDTYRRAIEVRDELIGDFLIHGMKHVPEAKLARLNEIQNGLTKLASVNGAQYLSADNLKSVYYKTAQIVDPGVFVDFDKERERIKTMIQTNYNTDQFDTVVDAFFDPVAKNSVVSHENYFESALTAICVESAKSKGSLHAHSKEEFKNGATVAAAFLNGMESLGCISKDDIVYFLKNWVDNK
jgi:hypothetical protein